MTRTAIITSVAIVALLTTSACRKSEEAMPLATARDQAQAIQTSLALPADAASAMQPPTDAVGVANATPAPMDAGASMVRVLGAPPTLMSTSKSLHQGATPHLFHLGATDFFLDHDELALTSEQRSKLSGIRETAMLGYATNQRAIDQAEQELWSITSADHPSARQVETKLTEIARLSTRQRMDYILAIGYAVAELTHAQHQRLAMPDPVPSGSAAMPMPADVAPPMPGDAPPDMPMGASGSAKPMGHM